MKKQASAPSVTAGESSTIGSSPSRIVPSASGTPVPAAIIVQQGKLLDFIDGQTQREETPEEYVRQEIAKSLVREYGYPKKEIRVEFGLSLGSRKPRADLVIFAPGGPYTQDKASLIVECKAQ